MKKMGSMNKIGHTQDGKKIYIKHHKGQEFVVRIGNIADTYYLDRMMNFEPHFGRLNRYEEEIDFFFWSLVMKILKSEELTNEMNSYSGDVFYDKIGEVLESKIKETLM
jgi:hypothetical protein